MKETLQDKLAKRKYKRPNRFIWWILVRFFAPIIMKSYGKQVLTKIDDINKYKGPKFLVYNHQSRFDWINVVKLCGNEPVNFVIGYNEFFRKHFKFIFKLIHAIPKKNFTSDISSMKAMTKIINDGGIVCFSPEGMSSITGHNQPIVSGTGKFIKYFGIPVYVMKSKGAYLVNHKVYIENRKGPMEAEMKCLLTNEQISNLSPEEIDDIVNEAIWQDDYEWNKEKKYHYERMSNAALHYEDLAYYCPKCGHEFEMASSGNRFYCKHCNNETCIDDKYEMHPTEGSIIPESLSKWVDMERAIEYERIKKDENYEFIVEDCILGELPKYKYLTKHKTSLYCGKGRVKINREGFFFDGVRNGKPFSFKLDYKVFWTLTLVTDCTFTGLYYQGEYLEIIPPKPVIGKMLLLVEEFSRYTTNVWPNFKWMSKIYDGSLIPEVEKKIK